MLTLAVCYLVDPVSIVDDFSTSAAAAAHPLAGVEECIPLITRLELDVDTKLVLVRWSRIGNGGVGELLEHFFRTSAPSERPDGDVCWGVVLSLE